MPLDRDHAAERLARIDRQLTDTKRTAATIITPDQLLAIESDGLLAIKLDRLLARQLISQLDAMLRELTPPTSKPRR